MPTLMETTDGCLAEVGQQPLLKIYTQVCLCFPMTDDTSKSLVADTLKAGLERASERFPWIAGQVINEGAGKGISGVHKIKPSSEKTPRLVIKDLSADSAIPTMDALRQARFPCSMLNESFTMPIKTCPEDSERAGQAPVFLMQTTFITGGLILGFAGSHNAMDIVGQGQIMHLLSKACSNEPFTNEELSTGNFVGRHAIPLLEDSWAPGSDFSHQLVQVIPKYSAHSSSERLQAPADSPKCSWANFAFSADSLTVLKSLTLETIDSAVEYISTDDAVTAFLWKSIMRARLPRVAMDAKNTLARAVDARRYLNIPSTYPGLVHNMAYHSHNLYELLDVPLGRLASELRSAVDPKTSGLGYATRALATLMDRAPDKSVVSFTGAMDLSEDLMVSSWAKINSYELDFGLGLGKPEAVRRPQWGPVQGLVYLLPRSENGEMVAAIALRDRDLERLSVDVEFLEHARYIG